MHERCFYDLRNGIITCLEDAYQKDSVEAGWGLRKDGEVSVVNTVEAVLTYEALGAMDLLEQKKADIANYLSKETEEDLKKEFVLLDIYLMPERGFVFLGIMNGNPKLFIK